MKPGTPDSSSRAKSLARSRGSEDNLHGVHYQTPSRKSLEKLALQPINVDLGLKAAMENAFKQNLMISRIKKEDKESFKLSNKIFYNKRPNESMETIGLMQILSQSHNQSHGPSSPTKRSLSTYRGTQNRTPECVPVNEMTPCLNMYTPVPVKLPNLCLSTSLESVGEPVVKGGSLTDRVARVKSIEGLTVTPTAHRKEYPNERILSDRSHYHANKNEKVYESMPFQSFPMGRKLQNPASSERIKSQKFKESFERKGFLLFSKDHRQTSQENDRSTSAERKRSSRGGARKLKPSSRSKESRDLIMETAPDIRDFSGINLIKKSENTPAYKIKGSPKQHQQININKDMITAITKGLPIDIANYYIKKMDKYVGKPKGETSERKSQKSTHTMTMSKETDYTQQSSGNDPSMVKEGREKNHKKGKSKGKEKNKEDESRMILYSEIYPKKEKEKKELRMKGY